MWHGMHDAFKSAAFGLVVALAGCNASNEAESQALRAEAARLKAESQKLREEAARLKSQAGQLEARRAAVEKPGIKGAPGGWELQWNDATGVSVPALVEEYPEAQATAKEIVNGLNRTRSAASIEYVTQRGPIVFPGVKDAERLTQQMGTTGACQYLAGVVLSLTSLPGVEVVHFDFPAGDHASPGFYTRADFIGLC